MSLQFLGEGSDFAWEDLSWKGYRLYSVVDLIASVADGQGHHCLRTIKFPFSLYSFVVLPIPLFQTSSLFNFPFS